jgi:hypothetical protein
MDPKPASYFGAHKLPDLIRQNQGNAAVDELDAEGRTPLFYARTVEEARFLVLIGVDPEHRDYSGTPATYHVRPEVGHYLVHGPKASYFGAFHPKVLDLNNLAGADPNERDKQGRTPLFYAPTPAVAKYLIEQGAVLDVVDNTGASPLFTVPGGSGVVDMLVNDHQLDPNAKDSEGNSVLHLTGDSELLKDALAAGAFPLLVNRTGLNALEYRGLNSSGGTGTAATNGIPNNPPAEEDEENIIMQVLHGIFEALTEAIGIRSRRR